MMVGALKNKMVDMLLSKKKLSYIFCVVGAGVRNAQCMAWNLFNNSKKTFYHLKTIFNNVKLVLKLNKKWF